MASTPHPPDEGENGHASEPAGFRLSDMQRLAELRPDGAAESSPEASAPVFLSDGVNGHAVSTGVRSSDAEPIASERLDGAAEGSLEEALAIVPTNAPPKVASSLVDRIGLVGDGLAEQPLEPPLDANPIEASDQVSVDAQEPEPSAAAPATVDGGGAIVPEASVAAPSPAGPAADDGLTAEPTEALHAPAGDTSQIVAVAQSPHQGASGNVRPLASALDAAAKLAADANAAAEALENLKRLLERQLPNVAENNAPAAAAATQHAPANPAAAPVAPPQPPALPLHAVRDGSGRTTLRPAVLAPLPPRHAPERVRLDVRGFLAGFALSWAVGVVLYLFMTSG